MDWIKCIASRLRRAGRRQGGITLIETVVAIAIFGIVSTSMITVLTSATAADGLARERSIALELAQQQVEYIRQLGYVNAGTVSGNPVGIVAASQDKLVTGLYYTLSTNINWVDDPIPAGFVTSANYKRVRVVVTRKTDGKELARVSTYLSSATRDPLGGLNNAIINVQTKDYLTQALLGGATVNLTKPPTGFSSNDTTDNTTGSPTFGRVTFAALDPTDTGEYYDIRASLTANGQTYATLKDDLPPSSAAHLTLDPSATANTIIRLYVPCSISVRVIDQSTGQLYTGDATVTISSARGSQAFPTNTGLVSLGPTDTLAGEQVVPGSGYKITVDTPGHRHGELTGLTVPANYAGGVYTSSFNVTLATVVVPQTATLTIDVHRISHSYDSCSSGSHVSGASVTVSDPAQSPPFTQVINTNSSGLAVFSNIPLGTYDVDARIYYNHAWRVAGLSDQPLTGDTTLCVPILY